MSKPFDATMRKLIELEPAAWLRFLHIQVADPDRIRVIDSNLSTVIAEADKVLWVDDPAPWIVHVELQAARDLRLGDRLHMYSTLLGYQHRVPIRTSEVLLRPAADGPELSGMFEQRRPNGDVYDLFRYDLVNEITQGVSAMILGIRGIEESSVYQDIFAQGEAKGEARGEARGRAEEAREAVLTVGRKRLGQPDDGVLGKINAINEVDRLNSLLDRILDVSNWEELLSFADAPT
jgi:predicted transposase YdaD